MTNPVEPLDEKALREAEALTVTSFPPAEQHDVTSHAVPSDGEGAVASDFMSLAAHLAKVNAGRPVVEGSETGVYVHRDVCIEAMQALLASSPTPPTAPAVPAGLTEIIDGLREDYKTVREWSGSALVANELSKRDTREGLTQLYSDLCRLGNALEYYADALSALPAPNSSEGEPT